jgi:uncharacterized protein
MSQSETLARVNNASGCMKVFPLPSVVLLPGGLLPLHIFEPRYRDMVNDALASDSVFAMAHLQVGERTHGGAPRLAPMLCVGVVIMHETAEDGRINLVLQGVARAVVKNELPQTKRYREVEVDIVKDEPESDDAELRSALLELIARIPVEAGTELAQMTALKQGGNLADAIASAVIGDVDRRLELLEQPNAESRIRAVTEDLMEFIARVKPKRAHTGMMN